MYSCVVRPYTPVNNSISCEQYFDIFCLVNLYFVKRIYILSDEFLINESVFCLTNRYILCDESIFCVMNLYFV